jgi:hypothetical protein
MAGFELLTAGWQSALVVGGKWRCPEVEYRATTRREERPRKQKERTLGSQRNVVEDVKIRENVIRRVADGNNGKKDKF